MIRSPSRRDDSAARTSDLVRKPGFFKRCQAEYPMFKGWNNALVDAGGQVMRVVPVLEEEMPLKPKPPGSPVAGVPICICCHIEARTVEVYPVPDQDYDLVIETRSWSAA